MAEDQVLTDEELQNALTALPGWEVRDGWLRRTFTTPGWPHTMQLTAAIGYVAEAAWHFGGNWMYIKGNWAEVPRGKGMALPALRWYSFVILKRTVLKQLREQMSWQGAILPGLTVTSPRTCVSIPKN